MRIVHLAETGEVAGGVERYLKTLLEHPAGKLEHAAVTASAGTCRWSGSWPAASWPWMSPTPGAPPDLIAASDVALVHSVPSPGALETLNGMARRVVIFAHDHRFWCPSGERYHSAIGRPCSIRAGDGACLLRYHALRCGSLRPAATLAGFARARNGRAALAAVPVVLCASNYMAQEARRHGARNTIVVPLPSPVAPGSPSGAGAAGPPLILSASRITPLKGIVQLLAAFERVPPPARLTIAGSGNADARVAELVARHPARDRITIAGVLSDAELDDEFRGASVVVVPSLWPEPFGLVGIEALGAGIPVVTSGRGGTADWADESRGVLTASPDEPAGFAAAIGRVLGEPVWRQRAATTGAAWVRERHGVEAHVGSLYGALGGGLQGGS